MVPEKQLAFLARENQTFRMVVASTGQGERMRAEEVYNHLLRVFDLYAATKGYNKARMEVIVDFGDETLRHIERGFAGNSHELDIAEANIRAVEAAYHLSPMKIRQAIASTSHRAAASPEERQSQLQVILQTVEPPSAWEKCGTTVVTNVLTNVVNYLLTHYLH